MATRIAFSSTPAPCTRRVPVERSTSEPVAPGTCSTAELTFAAQLAQKFGRPDYAVLNSTTQYKKVRPVNFSPEVEEWERRWVGAGAVITARLRYFRGG